MPFERRGGIGERLLELRARVGRWRNMGALERQLTVMQLKRGAEGEARGAGDGLSALIAAFFIWGLLPLYLRPLHGVAPSVIMAHRLVWCCVAVLAWLRMRGALGGVWAALAVPATRLRLMATAVLISVNWLLFVWAIGTGRVVESSLGYFINPLVNVLLGVIVLRERLNRLQWTAVAIAAVGVVYLTWLAGAPPWIALILAFSFGSYGLIRKTVAVDAMTGLAAETLIIAPLGIAYLVWRASSGQGAFDHASPLHVAMLILGGPITAIPLWLFAYGARRVRYATVGLVQYIGPTLQLTFGVFVFQEPFPPTTALGYSLIWCALALYAADGLLRTRQPTL
jgi:chloramphenicol-sensitive protein RarD